MVFIACAKNKLFNSSESYINIGSDSTLDIITWNVQNFPKENDITIEYLIELIGLMNVDIIAMQEIESEIDKIIFLLSIFLCLFKIFCTINVQNGSPNMAISLVD